MFTSMDACTVGHPCVRTRAVEWSLCVWHLVLLVLMAELYGKA